MYLELDGIALSCTDVDFVVAGAGALETVSGRRAAPCDQLAARRPHTEL